jgi:hypothetical protein
MKKKKNRLTDEAICDAIHEVIRPAGRAIPTDEASVAAAESQLANDMPELPERLRNSKFPPAADKVSARKVVPLWDPGVLAEPMARAAREGGVVSPEIEEVMKRDRKIAEQKLRDRKKDDNKDKENDDC